MAKQFAEIGKQHRDFIERQRIFFTASAARGSRINLSPKDAASLRVLGPNRVAYLDCTGSGNETSAHMLADGRLTIMLCAFEGPPLIMRLYGAGEVLRRGTAGYDDLLAGAFDGREPVGARQIVVLSVDLVQTSCGFGVPLFDYVDERPSLTRWAEAKGEEGLEAYRRAENTVSIDGLPTGWPSDEVAVPAE
ncbi:pyridoxamine 5'-phosphate oxidase family protein [Pseudoxanthobacter sp. M-2]|uniref:pyridoxamine 5'-phosphate oxidase family protein n=1 Tax=Pseudoxanthobacter sp. M-2 TaxID=3078754 RepID=UPI0038FC4CC5